MLSNDLIRSQKGNNPHRVSNPCYTTLKSITLTDLSKIAFVRVSKKAA